MTAKIRHNNKTDHHRLFSDKENQAKSDDILLGKGYSTYEYVNALMYRKEFQDYMQKQYQILPLLIFKKRIKKFINEIEINKKYGEHIKKWENLTKDQKVSLKLS